MTTPPTPRRVLALGAGLALLAVTGLAACSSSDKSGTAADGQYTLWDPYPQFDGSSAWAKLIGTCAAGAGITIKRTAYDTTDLTNKALLAAQQGNAPDVLIVDNPVVSTLADAGVLTTTQETGVDVSRIAPNLIAAGQSGGRTFGIPVGANTLALFYNKKVLDAAGVDPASVKDWASLNAALDKVKAKGKKGITFSAIGTEEGSFQFLPWFWGAQGRLTQLDGQGGVDALSLWDDWVKKGLAPKSVLTNTQTTSWQEFATGGYAFAENGTWQLENAKKAGFGYGIIPIPAKAGGTAPAPTGGEFVTVPVQRKAARYDASKKIVNCLTSGGNSLTADTTLSYIAPSADVQQKQVAADPELKVWVDAVGAAKGRTSDDLGTKYPKISQQMWTAVQAALSGSSSPASAMKTAQSSVK
jgi:multiple sugar transport system substrate-binding protein